MVSTPWLGAATPPSFNLCISNVPGVQHPLYRNGARLDAVLLAVDWSPTMPAT